MMNMQSLIAKLVKKLIILILLGSLASCTLPTRYERDPAKAGFGRDDVKKSRCACNKFYENGKWL
jgi:hypothetical protein